MKLKVKDWADFQHYKGRKPPWIKLHRGLLDNYHFFLLPVESRALAPMLWLIASENLDGSINLDSEALAFRLHMSSEALAQALKPLIERGFFVADDDASAMLAACLRPACPEAEAEAEAKAEREAERETEAAAEQRQSRGRAEAEDLPAAAAASSFNEPHASVFALATVEDYITATKRHARNPGGLARTIWRTGEEDARIGKWLTEKQERREIEERIRGQTAAEEPFSMDDYIDSMIASNWVAQLEYERDQIEKRGGPREAWEHRVIAYFNNQSAADAA